MMRTHSMWILLIRMASQLERLESVLLFTQVQWLNQIQLVVVDQNQIIRLSCLHQLVDSVSL